MWFQQIHQPFVTPGNRAAAVVAGFNIIVFSIIALLAHREKLAKKRSNVSTSATESEASEPATPTDEKSVAVGVVSYPPKSVEPTQ